jgi:CMP-N,N'-diacetyllegionaminic acid synthase
MGMGPQEKGRLMSSANVLALIPARSGSKGIPGKNFRDLAGRAPYLRAMDVALASGGCYTGHQHRHVFGRSAGGWRRGQTHRFLRPPELAQDDTPMIAVVNMRSRRSQARPSKSSCCCNPRNRLRQPKHLTAAIELLQASGADSVVSVVKVTSPEKLMRIACGQLWPWLSWLERDGRIRPNGWDIQVGDAFLGLRERRQDCQPGYARDGTVYAFWRRTVSTCANIYGADCRPLIIPSEETYPLDTPLDWENAERLLKLRDETEANSRR